MLTKTEHPCPFAKCRLTRGRTGTVMCLHDSRERLVDRWCDLGGRTCALLPAFVARQRPPGPELALSLYLIDLFGEDD
ncbi:MAG: hypothetical protein ACYC53_01260 [Bacillota bacterium]